jgi:hypothetical protein
MSLHTYPLEKYSALVKSTMSFKRTFNDMTDVRLEIQEGISASFKVFNSRNQELETHLIDAQMQCWQKEKTELWFKIVCKSQSQIKRFKTEFKSRDHCETIIAILEKFGIEIKRSPNVSNQQQLSTQAFIQEDSQLVPNDGSLNVSQPLVQEEPASLSQAVLLQESPLNVSPFQLSQPTPPFKNWKYSPLQEVDLASQGESSSSGCNPTTEAAKANPSPSLVLEEIQPLPLLPEDLLVEQVLAKRRVDETLQYLIKWSGISKEFATWKDYSSSWSLEDQQKALVFEKSLLSDVVIEDNDQEIIPYIFDLDLIE